MHCSMAAAKAMTAPALRDKILFLRQKLLFGNAVPTSTANRNQAASAGIQPRVSLPVDDTRIREIMELAPPAHLLREFPVSERAAKTTFETRQAIHRVLHGADDRLLVIVGPGSIHDYD